MVVKLRKVNLLMEKHKLPAKRTYAARVVTHSQIEQSGVRGGRFEGRG